MKELLVAFCEHIRNTPCVAFVVAGLVLHVCYKDVLAYGFDRGRVSETTESAQSASDLVSSVVMFSVVRIFFLIIFAVFLFFVCLSSFGVVLRFCTSHRRDSSWSLFVIVLSWGRSANVVEALPVITFSSLSLKSSAVVWLVVVLEWVVL